MSPAILWACAGGFWAAGARLLSLWRSYPVFGAFVLFEASRQTWFLLDYAAYWKWYSTAEMSTDVIGMAATVEAYLILVSQFRTVRRRARVLALICLPAIAAAALATDAPGAFHAILYSNQIAGLGLGVVCLLAAGLSAIGGRLSKNSRTHAGVLALLWLTSGVGAYLYQKGMKEAGRALLSPGPAFAMLVWACCMTADGEMRPPDNPEEHAKLKRQIDEAKAEGKSAGLL